MKILYLSFFVVSFLLFRSLSLGVDSAPFTPLVGRQITKNSLAEGLKSSGYDRFEISERAASRIFLPKSVPLFLWLCPASEGLAEFQMGPRNSERVHRFFSTRTDAHSFTEMILLCVRTDSWFPESGFNAGFIFSKFNCFSKCQNRILIQFVVVGIYSSSSFAFILKHFLITFL